MRQAFDDSLAVLLARKHCAFKGCIREYGWNEARADDGPRLDHEKLLEHVVSARESSVLLAADLLPACFPKKERIVAACDGPSLSKFVKEHPWRVIP
jgi:hypothetical protein